MALVMGLVFPLGVVWGVCDMWEEGRSLEWEFGGHGHCCMG